MIGLKFSTMAKRQARFISKENGVLLEQHLLSDQQMKFMEFLQFCTQTEQLLYMLQLKHHNQAFMLLHNNLLDIQHHMVQQVLLVWHMLNQ